MKKSIIRAMAAGALSFGAIVFTGCQKEEITNTGSNPLTSSKKVDQSLVCPILIGLGNSDIHGPLTQFQTTLFEK